jgi:lipopolysaccharide export system permease protein
VADSTAAVVTPPVTPTISASVDTMEMFRGSMLAAQTQLADARESLDSLSVEIQKKFALSFACLVFVLFGPPIALRFPRGGVGVTIGVSIVVFGLYYICLMGGEALADKGKLPAIVAMWIANVIFALVGILLAWRIESTTDGSRGGGLRERWQDRQVRRQLARERKARHAADQGPASVSP